MWQCQGQSPVSYGALILIVAILTFVNEKFLSTPYPTLLNESDVAFLSYFANQMI